MEMATSVRMPFVYGLLVLIFFTACNNIKGEVEKRGNLFFLVNTSTSKKYRFTIKQTEIQDGKIYRYATQFHELEPGEEVHIGEDTSFIPAKHPLKQREVIHIVNIPRKRELAAMQKVQRNSKEEYLSNVDPFASREERRKHSVEGEVYIPEGASIYKIPSYAKDTVINGVPMKYYFITERHYDKNEISSPSKSLKYKYEVKGQVEIKQ